LAYYEALGRRARRRKSSAARVNLFGAALTALRQAKAADQNGGSCDRHQASAGRLDPEASSADPA
jgi:hypothetical protein